MQDPRNDGVSATPAGCTGLFGGSFDPVHKGHLGLALAALESLHLSTLRWLPNSAPGHRESPRAGATERLAMLHIALGDELRFVIDESELWQSEPTYTVNTLSRLRGELGAGVPLVFIVGADHLMGLQRWKDWERLFDLTHFAVAERPGHAIDPKAMFPEVAAQYARRLAPTDAIAAKPGGCIVRFPLSPVDISSNEIRDLLAGGESNIALLRDMLPAAVLDYIESKRLYRANP